MPHLDPIPVSNVTAKTSRDHKRTTVRFTDAEFDRITEEAKTAGVSIPHILKLAHFTRRKLKLLLDETERFFVCSELRRIGNNVNQIARRVNSGALEGWHPEFSQALEALAEIRRVVVEAYGSR